MTYLILTRDRSDNPHLQDGQFYHDKPALFAALNVADASDRVIAFDVGELIADGSTAMRDVSEDMISEGLRCGSIEPDAAIAHDYVEHPARPAFYQRVA